jgi:hypothetical protein
MMMNSALKFNHFLKGLKKNIGIKIKLKPKENIKFIESQVALLKVNSLKTSKYKITKKNPQL